MTSRIVLATTFTAVLLLAGCARKSEPMTQELAAPAVFSGTIPCADCEGIALTLDLRTDSTYLERREYVGKAAEGQNVFVEKGTWKVSAGRIAFTPESGEGTSFAIKSKDVLRMLDRDGREIGSELNYDLQRAANYLPLRQAGAIFERTWELTELNGAMVPAVSGAQPAYINFSGESAMVTGFGGCNTLEGSFQITGDTLIFGHIETTKKICTTGEDIERKLLESLVKTWTYALTDDMLELKCDGVVVARFKSAVE